MEKLFEFFLKSTSLKKLRINPECSKLSFVKFLRLVLLLAQKSLG